jgi:acetoin utilization protein AcuB
VLNLSRSRLALALQLWREVELGEVAMKVRELMSRSVMTIGPADSCLEAVARMHRSGVRHLPVVDPTGELVGIVTDRDLRHHLFARHVLDEVGTITVDALLKAVPVSEVMSSPVLSAEADDDVIEAAHVMREDRVGSLPVVDAGRVIGIVTELDVLRQICRMDSACPRDIAEIVVSYP